MLKNSVKIRTICMIRVLSFSHVMKIWLSNMSDHKPSINTTQVLTLLQDHFALSITGLTPLEGGEVAQTFSFSVAGQDYIIRFNSSALAEAFAKEAYIFRHFTSPHVPMPTIEHLGQFQNFSYAISSKLPGQQLNKLPLEEFKRLIPALIETLVAIHQIDVRDRTGFGSFDAQGVGQSPTWRDHLAGVNQEEPEGQFFGKWHHLFETSFLERAYFESFYNRLVEALPYCPEERYLVHGDYGFDNVLAAEGAITAVLDWPNAKYGDFLYDVAWLDFWAAEANFHAQFHQYYLTHGWAIPHYTERIHCYQAYMGLNALRFFAKVGNHPAYQWVQSRISTIFPSGS